MQTIGGVPKISGIRQIVKSYPNIKMDPNTFDGLCHPKNPASIPEVVHGRSQEIGEPDPRNLINCCRKFNLSPTRI